LKRRHREKEKMLQLKLIKKERMISNCQRMKRRSKRRRQRKNRRLMEQEHKMVLNKLHQLI